MATAIGLPLSTFLSTLDWAALSHQRSHPAEKGFEACPVCKPRLPKPHLDNPSAAADRLEGSVCFRVARDHQLSFSPIQPGDANTTRTHAALAISEGTLRLALEAKPEALPTCLTLDIAHIVATPTVVRYKPGLCLELVFPFVTLLFEWEYPKDAVINGKLPEALINSQYLRFSAVRDAVAQLHGKPSSLDHVAASHSSGCKHSNNLSLFDTYLEQRQLQWVDTGIPDARDGLSRFISAGADLTMPPTFPYKVQSVTDIVSLDQDRHVAFVDAFVDQEAIRKAVTEEADAWVRLATRPRADSEDAMLTKAALEARNARRRAHQGYQGCPPS